MYIGNFKTQVARETLYFNYITHFLQKKCTYLACVRLTNNIYDVFDCR